MNIVHQIYMEKVKLLAKKIKNLMKKNWIIVRPTSIWGPWFDVPYKNLFDAILKGYAFFPKNLDHFVLTVLY